MDVLKALSANFEAKDNSFLYYYLHEESRFDEGAFSELCACIAELCLSRPGDQTVSSHIVFVYGQVFKHIIYHFDPSDLSRISGLPYEYHEKIEYLERLVLHYFQTGSNFSG